jgi:hypothetical protein
MSWTFDDLFFYGRAFWYITSRTADSVSRHRSLDYQPQWCKHLIKCHRFGLRHQTDIVFNGGGLDYNDVVQFLSPIQGIIYMSTTAVATALKLEKARYRNAAQRRLQVWYACVKLAVSL